MRRINCQGSMKVELSVWDKQEAESEDASEGTMLHQSVSDSSLDSTLNIEQLSAVEKAREIVEFWQNKKPVSETLYETKVSLTRNGVVVSDGTVDCLIVYEDGNAAIIDFKFGRILVGDSIDNIQLAAYALMAKMTFPAITGNVSVQIVQPRVSNGISEPYEYSDFKSLTESIFSIITECNDDSAPLKIGEWCKYCRGNQMMACPLYTQEKMELIKAPIETLPAIELWTDNQIVEWKAKVSDLKKFTEGTVDAELKERILKNGECGGYILKGRAGKRNVNDIMALFSLCEQHGFTDEEFLSKFCSIKIGELETALSKRLIEKASSSGVKLKSGDAKTMAKEKLDAYFYNDPSIKVLDLEN